jgi:periplasmic copper chaperone A
MNVKTKLQGGWVPRTLVLALLIIVAAPAAAFAHARVSPAVSLSGKLQLYSLAVPTEKEGATTTKIVLTVPKGFGIDSFVPPPPGWTQSVRSTGSGEAAVVQQVTWSGGRTPTGQDSLFQFLAQPASSGTYTFHVQQTYSDGSIVNWDGPESAESPAPTIQAASSLSGGGAGTSVLTIIALILGVLGLAVGGLALLGGGHRGGGGGRALA